MGKRKNRKKSKKRNCLLSKLGISCTHHFRSHSVSESLVTFVIVVPSFIHARLFATLWTVAHQASLSFTISQSLLKLMSIQSVMPSNHFFFCHPLLLLPSIFPTVRVFSSESALCIRWPKNWSFNFSMSPFNEYSGLISFRIYWLTGLISGLTSDDVQLY